MTPAILAVERMHEGEPDSAWLSFVEMPSAAKTKRWEVRSRRWNGLVLGTVKWFGRWRQYAFFPAEETVFNADCLRDIQKFIKFEMNLRTGSGRE